MSYEQSSHDTPNGVTLAVGDSDVTRLKAIANLTDRTEADVFAEAVEMLRHHYLPATRPAVVREPKQPRQPKAK